MTPNTGPFDMQVVSNAVSALFDRIGPAILVTHSQSGGPGWLTAIKNQNVRAVVAYEPGSNFMFPEGEVPAPMPSSAGTLEGVGVPLSEFMRLTKIPIVVYFGDNIPEQPTASPGEDNWRVRLAMARLWRDAVNRHGGDVTSRALAGNRHPRQHAFSFLGPQQSRNRRPDVRLSTEERPGLNPLCSLATPDASGNS